MLRIGCLGAARITPRVICHPASVRGDVALTAVAARDLKRAEAFAARYSFAAAVDSYAALIERPDVDLVYNALPAHLHAHWSIAALRAGKHVLCEKPFAMNAAQAEAVVAAARDSGKRVIEAYHDRYHPVWTRLLEWLAEGRIGEVRRIEAAFCAPIPDEGAGEIRHRPETGGGAFMDLGCYPLRWALEVMGRDPVAISATATLTPRGVDDALEAELDFGGGASARLTASMRLDVKRTAALTIAGARGRIQIDNPLNPILGSRLVVSTGQGEEVFTTPKVSSWFHQLDAVVAGLASGAALPTEGAAILRQQRQIDAVYAAAGLGYLRTTG